ncbi:hypothetical protein J6590_001841 [Homalodisca vitripennis]|nr:hypothetical protein J6590_001841 [Homalodisca vitripennis]
MTSTPHQIRHSPVLITARGSGRSRLTRFFSPRRGFASTSPLAGPITCNLSDIFHGAQEQPTIIPEDRRLRNLCPPRVGAPVYCAATPTHHGGGMSCALFARNLVVGGKESAASSAQRASVLQMFIALSPLFTYF